MNKMIWFKKNKENYRIMTVHSNYATVQSEVTRETLVESFPTKVLAFMILMTILSGMIIILVAFGIRTSFRYQKLK
ncbi:hypothetical protein HZS_7357 [Henneguya salminicola]|nr:hypothetical protein HZS_7357 [Henneguya salminicola]